MSPQDSRSIIGPFLPKLLMLLAISTGILVTEPPLATERTLRDEPQKIAEGNTGYTSHLWDDPLLPRGVDAASAQEIAGVTHLSSFIHGDVSMVLFVGMDGENDSAGIERRVRTHTAIASALSGRAEMLNYLGKGRLKPCHFSVGGGIQTLTCEIFEGLSLADARWFRVSQGKVAVVYVNENTLAPTPAHLAMLIANSHPDPATNPTRKFVYLGFNRSERLSTFLQEALSHQPPPPAETRPQALLPAAPRIEIYSPFATAEEAMLQRHLLKTRGEKAPNTVAQMEAMRLPTEQTPSFARSFQFSTPQLTGTLHRIGADDGELCGALIAELGLRGIRPSQAATGEPTEGILLLADLDRYHSRLLVNSFRAAWQRQSGGDGLHHWKSVANRQMGEKGDEFKFPAADFFGLTQPLSREVRVIHYLEVLDGMAPGPEAGKKASDPSKATADNFRSLGGTHAAEGNSQYDALRRLPQRLAALQAEDRVRYRAIGLLGSDVHDKLLLLRTLRPIFPDAVFFTNDLDARLWQGKERECSMNLIVAGAFGLTLDGILQGDLMPFRSSYQTATYLSCLHAIGFGHRPTCPCKTLPESLQKACLDRWAWPQREVEIHEVGRSGDHLLAYSSPGNPPAKSAPGRPTAMPQAAEAKYTAPIYRLAMLLLAVALILAAFPGKLHRRTAAAHQRAQRRAATQGWQVMQPLWKTEQDRENATARADRRFHFWRTGVCIAIALTLLAALFLPDWLAQDQAAGEPSPLFAGINSMPVVAGNLIVIATAIFQLWRSVLAIATGAGDARFIYPFESLPAWGNFQMPTGTVRMLTRENRTSRSLWDWLGWLRPVWILLTTRPPPGSHFRTRWQRANTLARKRHCWRLCQTINRVPDSQLIFSYARERIATRLGNRALRTGFYLLLAWGIYRIFAGEGDLTTPPTARGPAIRELYGWTDGLAKFCLALLALFAMDAQILVLHGLNQFNEYLQGRDDGEDTFENTANPPSAPTDSPPVHDPATEDPYAWGNRPDVAEAFFTRQIHLKSPTVGLWELPLLRVAAARFRVVTPLAATPFVLLFIIIVSRHSVFDSMHFSTKEIVLFATILTFLLCWSAVCQVHMSRSFQIVAARFRTATQLMPDVVADAEERQRFFDRQTTLLAELEKRTRYGLLGNPLVDAILLPLGGLGLLEFSSFLAPRL